jgi:glycosyltransferase involved in cell wall biosynthesis
VKLAYLTTEFPFAPVEAFFEPEVRSLSKLAQVFVIPSRATHATVCYHDLGATPVYLGLLDDTVLRLALREFALNPGRVARALVEVLFGKSALRAHVVNLLLFPKALALAAEVRRLGIEHIHANWLTSTATVGYVASQLTGVPFSMSGHQHDIFFDNLLRPKIARAQFTRIISARNCRHLQERLPDELAARCSVVHLGVEVPASIVEPPEREPKILCSARLCTWKGHRYLLAALAQLRDRGVAFSCDLAGEGEIRAEVAAGIARHGLRDRVRMLGNVPHDRLTAGLAAGEYDLVALASTEDEDEHEGIPVALMEAMAAGVPVVATRTGSIGELVVDGTGILVPQRDPEGLAEAMALLLANPGERRRVGLAGRQRVVEHFETSETTRRLAGLLGISPAVPARVPIEIG